ncbi:Carboxypeptidase Q [Orchesella cincta]|uniref:Carboxypeptidase Q n=1 Tax=Orchesella cincta TaxID=48709 RepID=A0A1D2NF44_ORCCI|nr:Carboxypeptidase Q [Orchesella cincta]
MKSFCNRIRFISSFLLSATLFGVANCQGGFQPGNGGENGQQSQLCTNVSQSLLEEIKRYQPIVNQIGQLILNGTYKGIAYKNLSEFVDNFGSRLTGSESLEKSIDHVLNTMKFIGLDDAHCEDVTAPKWVRGYESLTMTVPYKKNIQVLGLLPTVQTPEEGITSEIVVVESYRDLQENKNDVLSRVKGKILVFNHPFDDAVNAVTYRHRSAIEGAKVGAIATIVRSYATFSLSTPHTGEMHYEDDTPPIPSAEIAIEDAELLGRLYDRGQKIVLNLILRNQRVGNITTRNTIGDLKGSSIPDEYVLVSGHADSWDVGQGALDDGYGVILSLLVPDVLKTMNLIPKRTVRSIVWTAEEISKVPLGAQQYLEQHGDELRNKYSFFLEADSGIFNARGLIMNGTDEAQCIISEILKLLEPHIIEKTRVVTPFPDLKTDIVPLMRATGVPGAILDTDGEKYFWYHHSNADTVTALNPNDLDVCLALMTSLSYVLADLSIMLPKMVV